MGGEGGREGRTEERKEEFREAEKDGGEEKIMGGRKGRMGVTRNSRWDRDRKLRMDVGREGGREPAILARARAAPVVQLPGAADSREAPTAARTKPSQSRHQPTSSISAPARPLRGDGDRLRRTGRPQALRRRRRRRLREAAAAGPRGPGTGRGGGAGMLLRLRASDPPPRGAGPAGSRGPCA